jgi:hypothetical protein
MKAHLFHAVYETPTIARCLLSPTIADQWRTFLEMKGVTVSPITTIDDPPKQFPHLTAEVFASATREQIEQWVEEFRWYP